MAHHVQRCMIVPDQYAQLARDLCAGIPPGDSGKGMFTCGICDKSVEGPASHWINEGMIEDTFAALLPLTTFDADGAPTTTPGQPATIVYLAAQKGLSVTLAQVTALLSAIDVTLQDPATAMARLGLAVLQGAV